MDAGIYEWFDGGAEGVCREAVQIAPQGNSESFCIIVSHSISLEYPFSAVFEALCGS
jgi:hypothetical protein